MIGLQIYKQPDLRIASGELPTIYKCNPLHSVGQRVENVSVFSL